MSTQLKSGADIHSVDWIARAKELVPMVADAADRTEIEGKVPKDIMDALHDAELFRMCLPLSLGGGEASPKELMQVCETIAGADASTGWCVGQALGCTMAAGFVAPEVAKEVFGPKELARLPSSISEVKSFHESISINGISSYGSILKVALPITAVFFIALILTIWLKRTRKLGAN